MDAIDATREGKAPGKCEIPAEIWKYGGTEIVSKLHQLILSVWSEENVPQDWKDASIVPIFKKGSRKDCGNYRGVSLLKILSRVLLDSINMYIAGISVWFQEWSRHHGHELLLETDTREMYRTEHATVFCVHRLY